MKTELFDGFAPFALMLVGIALIASGMLWQQAREMKRKADDRKETLSPNPR